MTLKLEILTVEIFENLHQNIALCSVRQHANQGIYLKKKKKLHNICSYIQFLFTFSKIVFTFEIIETDNFH